MRRRRCAYLTIDDMSDFVTDADLSFAPMAELGWDVEMVSWRRHGANWDDFDAVYICTPWDYPEDPDAFMEALATIDRSRALLVNSLELVRWSLEKTYLRELESRGADIVPTSWHEKLDEKAIDDWFHQHAAKKLIIKPVVGANAADTWVLERPVPDSLVSQLRRAFSSRAFMVQPFIENIQTEGEYSLFFFSGCYSHAIRKTPKVGDFRVQEEHGADILSVSPPPELVDTATRVVALVNPEPVYVRADFVRGEDRRFLLMELELIEPALYFRTETGSAVRFAAAFDAYVRSVQTNTA